MDQPPSPPTRPDDSPPTPYSEWLDRWGMGLADWLFGEGLLKAKDKLEAADEIISFLHVNMTADPPPGYR